MWISDFGFQFLIANVARSQISEEFRIVKVALLLANSRIPDLLKGETDDERSHTFFFSFRYLPRKKRGKKTKAKTILNTLRLNMYIKS